MVDLATGSLTNVLFSRAQRQLLGLLFNSPDRSFYSNELLRMAKVGNGGGQRELKRLASAGLLNVRKVGNQTHYQVNHESPIFEELRSIVIKTFGLTEILREALKRVGDQIETAFVYGSIASEADRAGSDIDLMIISDTLTYPDIIEALTPAERAIGRAINPTVYKSQEFRDRLASPTVFLQRVMERPRIMLIGAESVSEKSRQSGKDR